MCLLVFTPITSWAENLRVLLILSNDSAPYQTLAKELKLKLQGSIQLHEYKSVNDSPSQFDLVVAVGMKAMESAVASNPPALLGVMIPKQGYESLRGQRPKAISAIYLDQPNDRQLDFIKAALPSARKIGMLYSPGMDSVMLDWKKSIIAKGMSLRAFPVPSSQDLYQILETTLDQVDLLLAIPDSPIYNSNSIRNILLTSYRHKIPLIGISPAYVKAGALAAIFSTPEEFAAQATEIITAFDRTGRLPDPNYSASFSIDFNQEVARSLGLLPDSTKMIKERMLKAEEGGR